MLCATIRTIMYPLGFEAARLLVNYGPVNALMRYTAGMAKLHKAIPRQPTATYNHFQSLFEMMLHHYIDHNLSKGTKRSIPKQPTRSEHRRLRTTRTTRNALTSCVLLLNNHMSPLPPNDNPKKNTNRKTKFIFAKSMQNSVSEGRTLTQ